MAAEQVPTYKEKVYPENQIKYAEEYILQTLSSNLIDNLVRVQNQSGVSQADAAEGAQDNLGDIYNEWIKNLQSFLNAHEHLKGKPIPNDWFGSIFKSTVEEWYVDVLATVRAIIRRDKYEKNLKRTREEALQDEEEALQEHPAKKMRTQRGGKTMKKRKNSKSKRKHKGKSHKKKGKR